jgi:hypothetical protein
MKRYIRITVAALAIALMLSANPNADAGRIGGPMVTAASVGGGESTFYSIPFAAGDRAVVNLVPTGRPLVYLIMHDTDGHVAQSAGGTGPQTVIMDVYRSGTFRVEVRNLGQRPVTYTLTTN